LATVLLLGIDGGREACVRPKTPQFSGRALPQVTWHFIPHGPLQLLDSRTAQSRKAFPLRIFSNVELQLVTKELLLKLFQPRLDFARNARVKHEFSH
jgi:hypothetical protein